MQVLETARQKVAQLLGGVQDVEEAVVRGERLHQGKCFAVAYVDLADDVVGRAEGLREFQERVLGEDYFNLPGNLRWNNYIYIVAGPKSIEQPDFQRAKAVIEADEDFARKRVVSEDELASVLGAAQYFTPSADSQEFDIVGEWGKLLAEAHIDGILDRPARTEMVERISSGQSERAPAQKKSPILHDDDKHLHEKWLSSLRVESFRPVHDGKATFDFGQVTLITGPNGTGKTSLLEAIEFFYCGQNRRAQTDDTAKVYGKLWDSNKELQATTKPARLRARCLHWYNREEKNSVGLLNGFGRYNFLDTDAAFRVAADLNPQELPEDLSRLIVGSDASQVWSYVDKLAPEVQTAAERALLKVQDAQKTFKDLQTKLKELQERPSEAKALSEAFRASLPLIGYRGILPSAPFASADEAKPIQTAYSALQALLAAGPGLTTLASLGARSRTIDEARRAVESLDTQAKALHTQIAEIESQAGNFDAWAKNLVRWAEYVRVRYAPIRDEYLRCRNLVTAAGSRIGALTNFEVLPVDQAYKYIRLVDALNGAIQGIQSASSEITSLEQLSASFGQAATARARTAQELKTAVLAALKGGAPATTCPVCKTVHGEAALAAHIERITAELAHPAELTELSEKLSAARERHKGWLAWKAFLEQLQQIALQLSLPLTQTCNEIVEAFSQARRDFEEAKANMQSASEALNRLHQAGMSDNEQNALLSSATTVPTLTQNPYDVAAVEAQSNTYLSSAAQTREQIPSLRVQSELLLERISQHMTPLFDGRWRTQTSMSAGLVAFSQLQQETLALERQRDELLHYFDVGNETKLSDVEATFAGTLRALTKAVEATTREQTASADISRLQSGIKNQEELTRKYQMRSLNLQAASTTLSKLSSELSLESATAKSLKAIGQEINEAFVRIHSPSEYEYVGSNGVLLRSKEDQEDWSLDKVSTGQRAAFALSVFLAVNRTAAKAPPVILIDDPVAHVDDLNALSFLDYLRDLAVMSKKQVFFATADARVASLFTRKFGFLGDDFKRIDLVRGVH
ncbi:AAA family ATPase [Craterilacuibacter sp. RT1T]|uniref:ATP-binding protein n=1 Tax=Craterilacuibacter sp. RT1T TaxID=2942211 RepID=UPI0020BDFC3E|nr:AAA family ATPase [Craterilacuibacter sp. RT1T]MCL6264518.1 AAA family ATPase [Craterilacuibacter sp. RT1T]